MLSGCTAFILAGGKSSRMGTDKALLNYRGECLIRYPIRLFQQLSPDVRIIGDPSRYAVFGFPVIAYCVPSPGPLRGIYPGLISSTTQYNLFRGSALKQEKAGADANESDCYTQCRGDGSPIRQALRKPQDLPANPLGHRKPYRRPLLQFRHCSSGKV